jgi:signal transduction histidine kinase/PAS domain-containing protein
VAGPESQSRAQKKVSGAHADALVNWMQELAPYGLFTTDAELNIQSWNEWLETHSGLAAPFLLGRPLLEVFPDLATRGMVDHFRRAINGEVIVLSAAFHEYLIPLSPTVRDAGFAHMQQTARLAPLNVGGEPTGVIVIIEDVTQREAQAADLAHRHARDRLLSSCLGQLLRARDPRNAVKDLFPRVAEFLHIDTFYSYLLGADGKTFELHAAFGVPDEHNAAFRTLNLEKSVSGHAASLRKPVLVNHVQTCGELFATLPRAAGLRAVTAHPLLVGDRLIGTIAFARRDRDVFTTEEVDFISTIAQYVAIAIDRGVTESALREAQASLTEHAHDLEDKIQERTARLQDTIAQLESFSYTVAHDLRAPVRALRGYAEVLLEEYPEDAAENSRLYLRKLHRASVRLEALTRDLLQFSRISRQELDLAKTDLSELLHDLRVLRPVLTDEILRVKQPLHPVIAQRTLLQQCLSNLIDNALKFVAPGVSPFITIWTERVRAGAFHHQTDLLSPFNPAISTLEPALSELASGNHADERVRIWIEDNGIGIAKESQKKIFGIFERLDSAEKYEGTGIGLAIVARAAQRMGGSCGVESSPGSGSRFWLELRPAA